MSKAEAYLNEALSLLVLFSYSSFTALDTYTHLAAYLDAIDTYHGYVWGLQLFPLLPLYIRRLAVQVSIFCSEVIPPSNSFVVLNLFQHLGLQSTDKFVAGLGCVWVRGRALGPEMPD
ncbi:hypothetical protein [Thiopseudomonas alkaliphila]|uniref:hypothetical protein n=1 Tax=Thiopseudomonas alkaliphila TaxID=1697053 RepID=UPI0011DD7F67|nr:hypothetical protein [Thiopseudomonas alkaliphila]